MAHAKIAIVGGGISGLSTAVALQKKGIAVDIYEKNAEFTGPDTGMVLSGNAIRSFYIMGLGGQLLSSGITSDCCSLKSDSGQLITRFDYQGPDHIPNYLFIQRSVLYKMLADALVPGSLHFGKQLVDFSQDSKAVTLSFKDGSKAVADCLIACDGGNSPIRKRLLPGSGLSFSGYACWRGYIDYPPVKDISFSETWGPRGRFGMAPLPGNRLYWYAFKKYVSGKQDMANWTSIDLLFNFFYYHDPIQQILESTSPENIIYDELYVLKPLEQFHFDKILLLGDSAHASIPNIGQGASHAIEDAIYLSKCLSTEESVEKAFSLYGRQRLKRIQLISSEMKIYGKAAQIDFPALCSIRNKLLQLAPASYHNEKLRKVVEIEADM